jgi:hypothetical protein
MENGKNVSAASADADACVVAAAGAAGAASHVLLLSAVAVP